jgi:hypothetical protein
MAKFKNSSSLCHTDVFDFFPAFVFLNRTFVTHTSSVCLLVYFASITTHQIRTFFFYCSHFPSYTCIILCVIYIRIRIEASLLLGPTHFPRPTSFARVCTPLRVCSYSGHDRTLSHNVNIDFYLSAMHLNSFSKPSVFSS